MTRILFFCFSLLLASGPAFSQSKDDALSQAEVDALRDAAFVPNERIETYIKILDTRERDIDDLLAKPHHVSFPGDIHDSMDQFAAIADELSDNLQELDAQHRDLRKALPKLLKANERWQTVLRAPADNDAYKVVRRIALDAVQEMHDMAAEMETSEAAYFKEHPDAAKAEKLRLGSPHAPENDGPK